MLCQRLSSQAVKGKQLLESDQNMTKCSVFYTAMVFCVAVTQASTLAVASDVPSTIPADNKTLAQQKADNEKQEKANQAWSDAIEAAIPAAVRRSAELRRAAQEAKRDEGPETDNAAESGAKGFKDGLKGAVKAITGDTGGAADKAADALTGINGIKEHQDGTLTNNDIADADAKLADLYDQHVRNAQHQIEKLKQKNEALQAQNHDIDEQLKQAAAQPAPAIVPAPVAQVDETDASPQWIKDALAKVAIKQAEQQKQDDDAKALAAQQAAAAAAEQQRLTRMAHQNELDQQEAENQRRAREADADRRRNEEMAKALQQGQQQNDAIQRNIREAQVEQKRRSDQMEEAHKREAAMLAAAQQQRQQQEAQRQQIRPPSPVVPSYTPSAPIPIPRW